LHERLLVEGIFDVEILDEESPPDDDGDVK
jgi:hypothetical protein